MEGMAGRIKKATIAELARQNAAMRELLEQWPAREIMMDYEKEWNEHRTRFLQTNSPPEVDPDFLPG